MRSSARSSGAGRGRVEWNHLLSNGGVKNIIFSMDYRHRRGGESFRPSQHLTNSIRHFSRLQIFILNAVTCRILHGCCCLVRKPMSVPFADRESIRGAVRLA